MSVLAINKSARFNYHLDETFEAGIVLSGVETKSVKKGHINLKSAYVTVLENELFLLKAHISPYRYDGHRQEYDPERARKLLLHRYELKKIIGKLQEKGLTIIPIKVYTKGNRVKVEIALARGKKLYDKREDQKKRDVERSLQRSLKHAY